MSMLISQTSHSAEKESFYRDLDCGARGGVSEFRNIDGTYTDCLTEHTSIEYDFAHKWYECLSQAGHYGILNNNSPICVLILTKESDLRYIGRANAFSMWYFKRPITIYTMKAY